MAAARHLLNRCPFPLEGKLFSFYKVTKMALNETETKINPTLYIS